MLDTVRSKRAQRAVVIVVAFLAVAPAAQALRVVNYNLTNYPGNSSAVRNPTFRTVLAPLAADVVVVQEMTSQTGVNTFRDQVLNQLEPGQWVAAPFLNGNDTDNALFYKPSTVQFLGGWAFYPNPATNLRYVNVYRLKPVGYSSSAAELRIYSCHLKASQGFETDRLNEAIGIRDSMNALPAGVHGLLVGDFNIYASTEPAFQKFLESQADNDGRVYDPLNAVGTWNSSSFAAIHTQCPCLNNCPVGFGFAGGGLDDRFDMLLPTYNLNNGNGLEILPATYIEVGNDGQHYNKDLNVAPVIPEGQAYADALVNSSDHLPVRLDVQVPAKIGVVAAVDFGTVIVGAVAQQSLTVTNTATSPADDLDYSFSAPAGFTAPGGSFALLAGASAPSLLGMSTASAAVRAGQLQVSSDDPDFPAKQVALGGTVLDHALASLDSVTQLVNALTDFGDHPAGTFTDQTVRVHNLGYDALQARLSVEQASITGPAAGRFTIVGGFSPVLVAGVSQAWAVHFDDGGLATDSTYTATLTFTNADEPLPGATAQAALVVELRARIQSGATDVASALPGMTRLYAPSPNPPGLEGTRLRFDLAQPADVSLEVFDVAGRRIVSLEHAALPAGVHGLQWDVRGDRGERLAAGVYFVRLGLAGQPSQTVRVTVLR